jgi:hypothetical protein
MSIQRKPLFFISNTIRLTHIRHKFKVENVPYDMTKWIYSSFQRPTKNAFDKSEVISKYHNKL